MNYRIYRLFTPMLAHLVTLQLTAMLFSKWLDSAAVTSIAALILGGPMYRQMKKEMEGRKEARLRKTEMLLPFLGAGGNLFFTWLMNVSGIYGQFSNVSQEMLYASALWIQVIGLGILVPVTEELIFRGLIGRRISRMYGENNGILWSAALFAAYHGNVIQMIYAFPMGLLLGWSYRKWNNITAPIMIHVGANLCGIGMQFFLR